MRKQSQGEMEFAFAESISPPRRRRMPQEFKAIAIRTIPLPDFMHRIDNPDDALRYWKFAIETGSQHLPTVECCYIIALNVRQRVLGHYLVATGSLTYIVVHPREIFRIAILINAFSLIIMHNHPSGESTPSEQDVLLTRDLRKAGQLIKIEVQDHVIVGNGCRSSLRELGYFY